MHTLYAPFGPPIVMFMSILAHAQYEKGIKKGKHTLGCRKVRARCLPQDTIQFLKPNSYKQKL